MAVSRDSRASRSRAPRTIISLLFTVAVWAAVAAEAKAGSVYVFTTDASPQPGTTEPASDLSGSIQFDNTGNLVTFDFAVLVAGGASYTFTPGNSSFLDSGSFYALSSTSAPPQGPSTTYTLYLNAPPFESSSQPNSDAYGLSMSSGSDRGVITSGLGQWTFATAGVPEPPSITLALIAAVTGLAYASKRRWFAFRPGAVKTRPEILSDNSREGRRRLPNNRRITVDDHVCSPHLELGDGC